MDFNSEDLFLNRAKFVMKYLGVWVPADNESLISKIYRTIMMTLQYLFLIFQIIYIAQVWGDLEAVSQASYLLFTQASLCFKITVFLVNIGILRDLLEQMRADVFQPETLVHEMYICFVFSNVEITCVDCVVPLVIMQLSLSD